MKKGGKMTIVMNIFEVVALIGVAAFVFDALHTIVRLNRELGNHDAE